MWEGKSDRSVQRPAHLLVSADNVKSLDGGSLFSRMRSEEERRQIFCVMQTVAGM